MTCKWEEEEEEERKEGVWEKKEIRVHSYLYW